MADTTSPETAVRNYLTFLSDPQSLVDAKEVERLEKAVTDADEVLAQVVARAALLKAKRQDPEVYERAFIEHAKAWADSNGVSGEVFEEMGVRRDMLQAAGLLAGARRSSARTPRRATSAAKTTAPRRASVKSEELEAGIFRLEGPFSVRDVSEKVGGSTITVTKAIERLEAQKKIVSAGERPNERGRASRIWTVAV
jgi:hypothetical protein